MFLMRRPARICSLVVVLLSTGAASAGAQGALRPVDAVIVNSTANPVPVSVVNPIPVSVLSAGVPFTLPPIQLSLALAGGEVAPDPSGTQYAITSLTVVNPSSSVVSIVLRATATEGASNNSCRFVFNQQAAAAGPELVVPPHGTGHVTFPQPYITAPVAGTYVCLVAGGDPAVIGVKWSAVGYKIIP